MDEVEAKFDVWDYVVLIIMLMISSSIGVYYRFTGGRQKTTQEYLLADRSMSITPVAFSLMASFMSAITLLGVSSENYTYGTQFVVINIAYILSTPIAAYLYLPVFFKLETTSAYEYLERRFGMASRLSASAIYSIQMILYMGIVLYAPALALEALTGIKKEIAILVIGFVCTFYSTLGGMKAVVITDVFQSFLMFLAIFSIIICAAIQTGGLDEIWKIADKGGRIEFFNFSPDPTERHTWFSLIIGGSVTYLSLYAVNQTQVQRYMTVKDLKTAQKTLWLNWPILTVLSLSTSFSGLAIYSKYYDCDPKTAGRITSTDQLMPFYVVESMGHIPGLTGLFVAGIFSASLSSISASVNSLAAVTLEDYIKPLYSSINKKSLPNSKIIIYTKILAFLYGVLCVAVAFLAQFLGGLLQAALTLFGLGGGPLLGLFTLGMFCTRSNQKGALSGLYIGLIISGWIAFGRPRPMPPTLPVSVEGCNSTTHILPGYVSSLTASRDDSQYFYLYRLSYLWVCVIGFLLTFIIGYVVSLLTGSNTEKLNPDLFVPPLANKLRRSLRRYSVSSQTSTSEINKKSDGNVIKNDFTTNL
ncbi:putative sodium-dependent multivitamin transporter [Chrysoperla carnea]|uniref:putative sodium-dependent multivitamin transporter n=1 Tax=Chrysoperla carnea TaxID=189513 RepID=UPI001D0716FD|nr:putative sodium-dependent multivitamin transporter [Chrysoperla carnea]XP_044729077.1 putative sodium-dependent multivitamin transporter [Chrysoperla carnea]XP_044729078.1 putative sodium-dependent multivitamin transporter [Chrysoperla carnea]